MHWTEQVEAANKLAREGDAAGADELLRAAMQRHPDEHWISLHYVRRAFVSQDWDAVKLRAQQYLDRFGVRSGIAGMAAQAFARQGSASYADELLRQAAARDGASVELLEAKALIDEQAMNWNSAIAHWEAYVAAVRTGKPQFPDKTPDYRIASFLPIFGYFTGDKWKIMPNMMFWRHLIGDNYRLIGDEEVRALISARKPSFLETYDAIRIPACKADVARLVYLEVHGGLYVDMHCTLGALDLFHQLPDDYERLDATFFSYVTDQPRLGNSIILAKPGAPVITDLVDKVTDNLERHRAAEMEAAEHVRYNIFMLSGPAAIQNNICEPGTLDINERYRGTVENRHIKPERQSCPILPFARYTYRSKGQHWSERQRVEPLFSR